MKHTPPVTEPIVLECDLPQPPALVWRALTERDLLGAWLLPNDLRPESGARFCFERPDQPRGDQPSGDQPSGDRPSGDSIECEVLQIEPNRTLRWRQTEQGDADSGWRPVTSVVTIELTDAIGGGTRLRLTHAEFTVAPVAASLTVATARKLQSNVTALRRRIPGARNATDVVCQLRRAA